ncbi:hypothetical protein A3L09_01930 [Thermococcus profundus]|uniref:Uncharacterized protein n=1 Tax=Thermococcus profundus TaxID=49899 RepID=A0A2Z2M9P4_THEPR|nr:hypothetical protein [Thermococcus profundus]ASJ02113.1 hypothetical protein A3L09_01930 [Thermococcus profundus]
MRGYYGGRVRIRAYLGDDGLPDAWSGVAPKLEPISGIAVSITPEVLDVVPGSNGTFEIRISAGSAAFRGVYPVYIVALGEDGWRGWAVVDVKVDG